MVVAGRLHGFADGEINPGRRPQHHRRHAVLPLDGLVHVDALFVHAHLMRSPDEYAVGVPTPRVGHCGGETEKKNVIKSIKNNCIHDTYYTQ